MQSKVGTCFRACRRRARGPDTGVQSPLIFLLCEEVAGEMELRLRTRKKGQPMFDGTFRYDERDPDTVEKKQPWQLSALLVALIVANYLAAVFCPDVVANPDLRF